MLPPRAHSGQRRAPFSRVVGLLHRNKRRLLMPRIVYLISPLRILPVAVFDFVASFLGINASMDEFVGRREQ